MHLAYTNADGDKAKHVIFRNTEEISAPIIETPPADKNSDAREEIALEGSKLRCLRSLFPISC